MQTPHRAWKIRSIFGFLMLFAVGEGCVAIYGFDEFDKKAPPNCETIAACPGSDLCAERSCEQNLCKLTNFKPTGTIVGKTEPGDCLQLVCDGAGNSNIAPDDADIPVDDDVCSIEKCSNGTLTREAAPEGTACGTVPTTTCNKAGVCAGCTTNSDCGEDTTCATWVCENSLCVKKLDILGTIVDDPVMGDCRKTACDGAGNEQESIIVTDVPPDGNDCTTDTCTEDGVAEYIAGNIGLPCGTCGLCLEGGLCGTCDMTQFDCPQTTCIPKPIPCTTNAECESTYCVDNFCCDNECAGTCMACSEAKTGKTSGVCAQITNDTDPDNECNNMPADICWDGVCRCANQEKDGLETGTDCGGNCMPCTGTWDCGGVDACNGKVTPQCCFQNPELCFSCSDQTQTCLGLQGSTCVIGTPPKVVTLGSVQQLTCLFVPTACRYTNCACK